MARSAASRSAVVAPASDDRLTIRTSSRNCSRSSGGTPTGPGVDEDGLAVVVAGGVPVPVELAAEQRGDVAQRLVEEVRILAPRLRGQQHVEDLVGRGPSGGDCHGWGP